MRRTTRTRALLLIPALVSLGLLSGCFSRMFGRSAGGELIWWCDRCQCQVGDPDAHVHGLTKYNPETGKEEPMKGVTQEMLEEARLQMASEASQDPSQAEHVRKWDEKRSTPESDNVPWWKPWRRKH